MKFVNQLSKGKNFEREEFIPIFSTEFTFQFLAIWIGNLDLVKWCLEYRSDNGNNRIDTLLRTGIFEGEPSSYNIVSSYGACYKRDGAGLNILHYAIRGKNVEIVKLLIEKYKANPFQSQLISPALLAYRMYTAAPKDEPSNKIYNLLKETYKEHLENHVESNKNIFDEANMKIFDLDETEEDDLEKLQIDKGPNGIPLNKNVLLERDYYIDEGLSDSDEELEVSDEDEEEEFIDIKTIRSKIHNVDSEDPWVQCVETEKELSKNITDLLKDTEIVQARHDFIDVYPSVRIGKRIGLEENNKKRAFEAGEGNEYEPKFKKRKEMIIPKAFFNGLTKVILGSYRFDTIISPSSQAIMQQEIERLCIELFNLTSEICKFFMTDLCLKNFILVAFNAYNGCFKESSIDEEALKNHLSSLSMKEISSENITSIVTEINEQNLMLSINYDTDEDDPDFEIEFDDPNDRVLFGIQSESNINQTKEESPKDDGYESDWSDESEIGIEISENNDFIFYPSSIDQIESERPLSETILGDEYAIKYESIQKDGKYGFNIYSKDTHLVKRLITNSQVDTQL
ncbi:predicted protein [Naegleria gruberi]|uniref:Predicted protein n=1 Tax=Naegleria gruberi TaxID=5762 RepID=D2W0K3_NAEGR|nr:uncharacterized protein NAEGRDRAFT_74889 [Naegleria gruberi]EFC37302.1 predicted protein [Naegleria gruberi]|eukprot:XP_002670046.1 predicted protein [Naegleria gruberi strain NEG-M]